ncbi:LemA family protein [Spiroplasma endosymbiont of Phyllotreta cruciferae]|uniref:LemA family protein n=1 Tax=Spiroplasma endosymbiont of Phyllotreta cruciferae TaxID=2886375 RepID=UPI0020A1EFE4|nr:LemA family protein [Spiroplasma endosymbiont of Phyllotreta cruciferae]
MGYNPTVNNAEVAAKSNFLGKFFVYIWFILIFPIFLFILSRNNLIRNKEKIEETASDIDVQLKRRVDMLTKLIDSTKQYMKYEKDTLTTIVELRSQANQNLNVKELDKVNNAITSQAGKINVLLENYPDLKANNSVIELQTGIKDCEDNIAVARRFYNSAVRDFNASLKTWPSNVATSSLRLNTFLYFEADVADRQDVKIDLWQ